MQVALELYHPVNGSGAGQMQSVQRLDTECSGTDTPLVSCLMVTKGEARFVRTAIQGFIDQSYQNKELIVVTAKPTPELAAAIKAFGDDRIKYTVAAAQSLGDLRN